MRLTQMRELMKKANTMVKKEEILAHQHTTVQELESQ